MPGQMQLRSSTKGLDIIPWNHSQQSITFNDIKKYKRGHDQRSSGIADTNIEGNRKIKAETTPLNQVTGINRMAVEDGHRRGHV